MNTFRWHLELSALGDLDRLDGLVARSLGHVLDLLDDVVSVEDLAEDDVAAIEPAGDDGGDEELGAWRMSVFVHAFSNADMTHRWCPCRCWPCSRDPCGCA